MPASSIAQVLLRLFALNWAVTGLSQIAYNVFMGAQYGFSYSLLLSLIPPLLLIAACVVTWWLAPAISRLLARGNDGAASLQGVTQSQLYATMFVGLGMYFALDSFADVFNWLHFFAIRSSPDYGFHRENSPSYYNLTESLLTLAAGIALIFTAHIWAEKLIHRAEKAAVS